MSVCRICPRKCGVDRKNNIGFCGVNDKFKIAKADLHFWEEPCISGKKGSGTVFFSGCSLGCAFCQNSILSHRKFGKEVSTERLSEIFFELKDRGANNINLVTADHFIDSLIPVITDAKKNGLDIPVILNTSSYLLPETVNRLDGIIDIYIADFKFFSAEVSAKYCKAPDYPEYAKKAIDLMHDQIPKCEYQNGILKKGVIVRTLVLPGNIIDAKLIIKYVLDRFGSDVCFSIMSQYTPVVKTEFAELSAHLTEAEYKSIVNFALAHGFQHGYIQESGAGTAEFIPDFDLKGV